MTARPKPALAQGDVERLKADVAEVRRRLRSAAHEIRTPLAGAATIVDLLAASDHASGPIRDYVLLLKDAVGQLIAVTNDMLDLGRVEADLGLGPREPFSPAALIVSTVELARPRAEARGLTVSVDAREAEARVSGYPVLLRRIVENLVDNAVKMTSSGRIEVKAKLADPHLLAVEVSDTGPGIDTRDLQAIFEPYAQLSSGQKAGGTGLGLALVKAAVERVDGAIEVQSIVGQGTSFRLSIPVGPPELVLASERPPDKSLSWDSARKPLDILVAEDNPVNRIVAGTILGEFGHRVAFSPDGEAAVAALSRARYDLVLMDIEMPGLDGSSALTAIRSLPGSAGAVPVVALSARGEEARPDLIARGFDGYVVKPIDPAALFAVIETMTAPRR